MLAPSPSRIMRNDPAISSSDPDTHTTGGPPGWGGTWGTPGTEPLVISVPS